MEEQRIAAVQRMQDYIEAHLCEEIALGELARASLFSPWYAHRLFSQYTGLSPGDYIRRLRLSRSALRLRDGGEKIAEVAFALGFKSVDGYQRAFYREFGCNPGEYVANPVPLYLFTPYGVKYRHGRKEDLMENGKNTENVKKVENVENVKNVFVREVNRPARKAVIKRGVRADNYWDYCMEVGCDVWGLLTSMKSLCGEPVCLWLPEAMRKPGTSSYVQGVEVPLDYSGPAPEGFDVIALPGAKYLMFQGEPFLEEDYQQAIGQVRAAIEKFDPALQGLRWDDANPRIQLEPRGARGYIEWVPVKA